MKIAIDITSVVYGTGVSIYTKNLIRALAKIDRKNEYVLFGGTLRQKHEMQEWFGQSQLGENFQLKIFPFPPRLQTLIWNDLHVLSLEKLLGSIDVYHSPDWSLAPTRAKTIITVHDLFFLKRPDLQKHPYKETLEKRLKRARYQQTQVIAVSESTKNDLIKLLDYPENLIEVIYEAVDPNFKPIKDKNFIKQVKDKYRIKGKYLLMVATLEPRKNLKRTIEAFGKVIGNQLSVVSKKNYSENRKPKTDNLTLVIAGKVGWGEDLLPASNVCFPGFIPNQELNALYSGSEGFLYPSLYEGFGIPILEAFTCGTPVLTSSVPSMPEVAGKAAIYVNPYSTESIRQGLEKMLNLKPADKSKLIKNGFKQLKKFSWEKAARETLNIYRNLE